MDKDTIIDTILSLSKSQGFYKRIYDEIINNKETLEYLESQKFKDVIDLIMFLES